MLYVAEYDEQAWLLLDAENPDHALAMIEKCGHDTPKRLREVPVGITMLEVYTEDDESQCEEYASKDVIPNPANHSQMGYALEPLEGFAAWLEATLLEAEAETPPETEAAPSDDEEPGAG